MHYLTATDTSNGSKIPAVTADNVSIQHHETTWLADPLPHVKWQQDLSSSCQLHRSYPLLQVGSMLTFGISSDLCMTGNDVKFDLEVVLPPWFEYLSETQRTNKVTTVLERKFVDKFVIKSGFSYNKRYCQFRGGEDIFILHRAQPLGAAILINRRVDLYQLWPGIWGNIWRRTQMWGYRTENKVWKWPCKSTEGISKHDSLNQSCHWVQLV